MLALTGCAHASQTVVSSDGWKLVAFNGNCYAVIPRSGVAAQNTMCDATSAPLIVMSKVAVGGLVLGGRLRHVAHVDVQVDGVTVRPILRAGWFLATTKSGHQWTVTAKNRRGDVIDTISGP